MQLQTSRWWVNGGSLVGRGRIAGGSLASRLPPSFLFFNPALRTRTTTTTAVTIFLLTGPFSGHRENKAVQPTHSDHCFCCCCYYSSCCCCCCCCCSYCCCCCCCYCQYTISRAATVVAAAAGAPFLPSSLAADLRHTSKKIYPSVEGEFLLLLVLVVLLLLLVVVLLLLLLLLLLSVCSRAAKSPFSVG